jgi:hypothetical protein
MVIPPSGPDISSPPAWAYHGDNGGPSCPPGRSGGGISRLRVALLPPLAIVLAVVLFWASFGLRINGLWEEWGSVRQLDAGDQLFWLDAQLPTHRTRPLDQAVFGLGYALTPDSFVGLNLVLAGFMVAKGLTLYALVRRLVPGDRVLALAAGLLFVFHPTNGALYATRHTHMVMAQTLYVLAACCLAAFWRRPTWLTLLGMWVALAGSLLTYEIAYPLALATPLALVWAARGVNRRVVAVTALWYLAPLLTAARAALILAGDDHTYQDGVLQGVRTYLARGGIRELPSHLGWAYWLSFGDGWRAAAERFVVDAPLVPYAVAIGLLAMIAALGLGPRGRAPVRGYVALLGAGLAAIGIGPALYLIMPSHYSQPFEQSLATRWLESHSAHMVALGAAMILATLVRLGAHGRFGSGASLLAVGALVGLGALENLGFHRQFVELDTAQQRLLGQLVEQAPQINGPTVVAIIDETSQFGDRWFLAGMPPEWPLRYLYSNPQIFGVMCPAGDGYNYRYGPVTRCRFEADGLVVETYRPKAGAPAEKSYPYEGLLVFRYDSDARLHLLDRPPGMEQGGATAYDPRRLVSGPEPARRAAGLLACLPIETCMPPLRPPPREAVTIGFDELAPGAGWSPPLPIVGTGTYRWSTSSRATVRVGLLSGRDYRLSFRVVHAPERPILDGLQVSVNEHAVPLTRRNDPTGGYLFEGTVDRGALAGSDDDVDVAFTVPALIARGEYIPVGVLVDWLRIEAVEAPRAAWMDVDQAGAGKG